MEPAHHNPPTFHRPDPSKEGPERQEQIRAWLGTAGGKRQIDAFLAATSKRGGQ